MDPVKHLNDKLELFIREETKSEAFIGSRSCGFLLVLTSYLLSITNTSDCPKQSCKADIQLSDI